MLRSNHPVIPTTMRRLPSLLTVLLALCFIPAITRATVYFDTCASPADHPKMVDGDFYNLCIRDHEFTSRNHAWKFTKADIADTIFKDCTFTNKQYDINNFTEAVWTDVKFDGCSFGSFDINEPTIVFDKTRLRNVLFESCEFSHSVDMVFSDFTFDNVTFHNCSFKGDTVFRSGQINKGVISDSRIMHNTETKARSGNDSFTFLQVTLRELTVLNSHFVSPLRFHAVDAADLSFNGTIINTMNCHSDPDSKGKIELMTSFNDTVFQAVTFADEVRCDQTSWRGFFMGNVTFQDDADFSSSNIRDIYFDEVESTSPTNDCKQLNFSYSYLKRKVFANVTVGCVANFEKTKFETVFVKNLKAEEPRFNKAEFIDQEYIDGVCCSTSCMSLKCLCNVSEPSGNCPIGSKSVNVSAISESCFPGDATVRSSKGSVITMEELAHHERIAVGRGELSPVYFFGHRMRDAMAEYVVLTHDKSTTPLRLSAQHYLYVNGRLQVAASVTAGDRLRSEDGIDNAVVTHVDVEKRVGVYAPTSMHGDLLVDGIIVSSYTNAVHPRLAHRLLQPLRLMYRFGLTTLVERATALEQRSWEPVARWLRLPRGPDVVAEI